MPSQGGVPGSGTPPQDDEGEDGVPSSPGVPSEPARQGLGNDVSGPVWDTGRDASFASKGARLLFRGLGQRGYGHEGAPAARLEADMARYQREERMVLAHADIGAGMPFGAALTHDDVARNHGFRAELLDAERRPSESRPLRDEPPAFLCAMG